MHFNVAVWNPALPALPVLIPLVVEDDVVDAVLPLSDGCTWPMAELTPPPPLDEVADEVLTPSGGVEAFNSADPTLPCRPLFIFPPFPDDRRLVAEPEELGECWDPLDGVRDSCGPLFPVLPGGLPP